MNKEFFEALDLLEKERHIPKEYMIEKVEAALATACKRELGTTNITVVVDAEKQDIKVYRKYKIVSVVEDPQTEITKDQITELEINMKAQGKKFKTRSRKRSVGADYEYELQTKEFRRLSAQNAKQVIIQAIREAERSYQAKAHGGPLRLAAAHRKRGAPRPPWNPAPEPRAMRHAACARDRQPPRPVGPQRRDL